MSVWRTTWVVSRRSRDRIIPPCSAIARNRLENCQSVIHDASQTTYTSGRSTAIDMPNITTCSPQDLPGLNTATQESMGPTASFACSR